MQVDLKDKWRNLERQNKVPWIPGLRNPAYQGTIHLLPSPDTGPGDQDRLELLAVAAAGMRFVHHPPPSGAAAPAGSPPSTTPVVVSGPTVPPLPVLASHRPGVPTRSGGPWVPQSPAPLLLTGGPGADPSGASPGHLQQGTPQSGPLVGPGAGVVMETGPSDTLMDDAGEEEREEVADGLLQLASMEPSPRLGDPANETVEGPSVSLPPAGVAGGSDPASTAMGGLLQGFGVSRLLQRLPGRSKAADQQGPADTEAPVPREAGPSGGSQPPQKRKRGRPLGWRKHRPSGDAAAAEEGGNKRSKVKPPVWR